MRLFRLPGGGAGSTDGRATRHPNRGFDASTGEQGDSAGKINNRFRRHQLGLFKQQTSGSQKNVSYNPKQTATASPNSQRTNFNQTANNNMGNVHQVRNTFFSNYLETRGSKVPMVLLFVGHFVHNGNCVFSAQIGILFCYGSLKLNTDSVLLLMYLHAICFIKLRLKGMN